MARRSVELDALRGVAALMVVLFHYTTSFDQLIGWDHRPLVMVPWGHYGVNLFFVISGFVITASTSRNPPALRFAAHRIARIYPAYLAAVVVSAVVATISNRPGWHLGPAEVLINLTMWQRFIGVTNVDGVYWTLALELLFYVFVGVLLATGMWRRPARDWWLVCWSVASLAWSLLPYQDEVAWHERPWSLILFYGPLFIAGILIKEGAGTDRSTRLPTLITAVAAAAAFAVAAEPSELAISAAAVAAVALTAGRPPRLLSWRPLVAVGEASYVLYLIHQVPGTAALAVLEGRVPSTLAVALVTAVAMAASIVLHRHLEVPATRWARLTLERVTAGRPASDTPGRVGS